MKAVLLIGAMSAMALIAVPASADNQAAPPQANVFDWRAQAEAFPNGGSPPNIAKQCFNGKSIAGVNRSGAQTLYVQSQQGGIYQMRLTNDCEGLNGAEKLSVRANGVDLVCPGDNAELVARIASASKHCRVTDVRRLTAKEVSTLASAAR